jgi:hypothetical protein
MIDGHLARTIALGVGLLLLMSILFAKDLKRALIVLWKAFHNMNADKRGVG